MHKQGLCEHSLVFVHLDASGQRLTCLWDTGRCSHDRACMSVSKVWPHNGDCSSMVCSTMMGSSLQTVRLSVAQAVHGSRFSCSKTAASSAAGMQETSSDQARMLCQPAVHSAMHALHGSNAAWTTRVIGACVCR